MLIIGILLVSIIIISGCGCSTSARARDADDIFAKCFEDYANDFNKLDHCLLSEGRTSLNAHTCEEIQRDERKAKCLLEIAKETKDPAWCNDPVLSAINDDIYEDLDPGDCEKAVKGEKECGEYLQACCYNNNCDTDLFCDQYYRCRLIDDKKEETKNILCGSVGQACCKETESETKCINPNIACENNICVEGDCGYAIGSKCCRYGTLCPGTGLSCKTGNVCDKIGCGEIGEPVCDATTCYSGSPEFKDNKWTCVESTTAKSENCGNEGQKCCDKPDEFGNYCPGTSFGECKPDGYCFNRLCGDKGGQACNNDRCYTGTLLIQESGMGYCT